MQTKSRLNLDSVEAPALKLATASNVLDVKDPFKELHYFVAKGTPLKLDIARYLR
jgi:hypothetical protein